MNSPRSSWDALTAELFQNKKDIGQVREPGVSRWVDGHELAGLSVTRQVYPGCCIKKSTHVVWMLVWSENGIWS